MPRDKRLSRPQDYLDEVDLFFRKGSKGLRKIDYEESFRAKSDQPPFDINRFGKEELLNKITSKKPTLNRRLDFVDDPTSFELFTGLGRFDNGRTSEEDPSMSLYSFDEGRANTKLDFRQTPEYQAKGELWKERYMLSPTISPGDRITNPMPRVANPDPKNYLLMTAKNVQRMKWKAT
jgi:hypothetical protein